ncbi:hypothetical protein U2F26_34995 [Micromonospora sp. 4G57]|uniref:Uncharacterized protein n=1 Tax=Micromonospora sicca TaxID=2202420 RepID=A0ABU5JPV7_9ACTN|nr:MULTISPECIES: hypothetical protein [unclassified Micromonospora]MDZ5447848.1 hypothetical protein [Micromonospora sp. 4G57]MDZ5494582.1 hypothetical protein [Micromonospora sp. 4G53]
MALFGSRRRTASSKRRFPSDMPAWLAALGRFEWSPQTNPAPEQRVAEFYFMAQADRDSFLRDLASISVPAGGWTALGGKYLVTDILPIETDTPEFNAIVAAGLKFLRDNGVPPNRLSPNDRTLWRRVNTTGENWLDWRPTPADTLVPLAMGEERKIAEIRRSDGYINSIIVRSDGPTSFVAMIEGPYSEEEPRITRNDWHIAPTLHELYIRVGESSQVPTDWASDDLKPYFPLPPMTI